MSEVQVTSGPSQSQSELGSQRGGHRGRGRGRGRGWAPRGRGPRHGPRSAPNNGESGQSEQAQQSQPSQQAQNQPTGNGSGASTEAPHQAPRHPRGDRGDGGRGRGDGQRHGRGRGGRSVVVSHRAVPGRQQQAASVPAQQEASGDSSGLGAGLSADAPEFVPGQPVAASQARPKRSAPRPKPAATVAKSSADDLPTRIHEDIDHNQYECVICTNEVTRTSRVWSCSICWTVIHLNCVRKWFTNQTQALDPDQPLSWRCPGCNSSLTEEPGQYHCWCGKDFDPKPIAGLPPHSCGQTCTKPRATSCPHPCNLMCHAGPCPPCTLMGPTQTCYCGKHTSTKRCSETDYGKGFSCNEVCGDLLPCGEHTCSQLCHSGLCGACELPVLSTCYCGKEQREIPCNKRDDIIESFNYRSDDDAEQGSWFEGSFQCGKACGRKFDCGHHVCEKPCHPQDGDAAHCPFSPDVVTHCPCGKTPLESISTDPRQSCQDPIPHCDKPCNKALSCGHTCQDKCHTGPCAPCQQVVDVSCRCGRTTEKSICHQATTTEDLLICERVCRTQLNCGRHECKTICCPGEKKAAERRKQNQKRNNAPAGENYEAEHICLRLCGRPLKCGNHTCQQLCHKGACASCLEAIFDEISCACGRSVLQPPQPCGTRPPECRFPCTRARPCGHPSVSHHNCHPDEVACPKCAVLVDRSCVCGKKTLKNQPCWFDQPRCGLPCGKKLKCGTHECKKTCHGPGECEDAGIAGSHCTQQCGKTRKSCEHACTDQCHAPYPCKEDKPCPSKTFITCPCQHRKGEVRCQATKSNPWPWRDQQTPLKCDEECLRLQRNRQLAEALRIDPETHTDEHIPYSDTTLKLYRENVTWAQAREAEFRLFADAKDQKRLRFKPMPPSQRAFLHSLAEDYGLDSESQDPEPHRHVCIFKTPRFVSAPRKTLEQCRPAAPKPSAVVKSAAKQNARPPFNAFLLKNPRFGLTIDEVDAALARDLATVSATLRFTTSFLPFDQIVIRAEPTASAAAVAANVETTLGSLLPAVARTVSRLGLASAPPFVALCHADPNLNILRVEGGVESQAAAAAAAPGGWNTVAQRSSWWRRAQPTPAASEQRPRSTFLALRKKPAALARYESVVEDDWLAAVEKEEQEQEQLSEGEQSRQGAEETREASEGEKEDANEDAEATTAEGSTAGEQVDDGGAGDDSHAEETPEETHVEGCEDNDSHIEEETGKEV
ncbi:hypothetical protein QBC46DRAFT_380857 [Diplogelasinospora grovesii]|uniref:R3H domain-containing protein n=1 Tax=Diplogelasinospora grovesii TaxID=303347 RepID=A0AAN6NCE8_9PEZI|nr:hypothetical protein QBC46DRAFT_380857 [Diplogelasinospora grovesii]